MLPFSGQFRLADYVTFIGLFTIFLSVVALLTSAHFFSNRDEKDFSRELDKVSWITIGVGFRAINIALSISAMN